MADATGSSAGAGTGTGPGPAMGHGDLGRGTTQGQHQAFLTSSTSGIIAPSAANIYPQTHQQYPLGLIPASVGVSMPAPRLMYSNQIVMQPQHLAPLPQYRVFQPHQPPPLAGHYQLQDYSDYGNTTSSTSPSVGGADWRMYGNILMPLPHQTPFGSSSGNISVNSRGFHQNSSPYSTSMWTNYMPMSQPYSINYVPAAINNPVLQAPSFHNNNQQERDYLGFATSFEATTPLAPAPPFVVMPQRTTNSTSSQIFKAVKTSDGTGTSRASGSVEITPNSTSDQIFQAVKTLDGTGTLRASGSVDITPNSTSDQIVQAVKTLDGTGTSKASRSVDITTNSTSDQIFQAVKTLDGTGTLRASGSVEITTNSTSAQIFQAVKTLDGTGTSKASGSVEIEGSEATEETDPASELEAQNQLGQGVEPSDYTMLNCKHYRTVLRKDLTNSDCGNIGRIVLPKRDAEANLPILIDKDGIILEMDDLKLPNVWRFKYRYWPNNKSRMYILESTGDFVKRHNLEAGDIFIIYQHKRTGRQVARAVKASQLNSNMNLLECQCQKEGNSGEECGFAVEPPTKKT